MAISQSIKLKCICGHEKEFKRKSMLLPEFNWKSIGTKWVCELCQAEPKRLSDIVNEDSETVKNIYYEEEIVEEIKQVWRTSDGCCHKDEETAKKYLNKKSLLAKLRLIVNDPVIFNENQLECIVENYELIKEVMESQDERQSDI
jgi:hypothetical protein